MVKNRIMMNVCILTLRPVLLQMSFGVHSICMLELKQFERLETRESNSV